MSEEQGKSKQEISKVEKSSNLDIPKSFSSWLQLIVLITGSIVAITASLETHPLQLFIGAGIVVFGIGWHLVSLRIKRKKPALRKEFKLHNEGASYLRALLPFEEGEKLLGRDTDIAQLLAKTGGLEFQFGYLTGDAGAGKTSVLRAGVIPLLRKTGHFPIYVARTGSSPAAALYSSLQLLRDSKRESIKAIIQAEMTFRDLVRAIRSEIPEKKIIIIFDQFEEYFVHHPTPERRLDAARDMLNTHGDSSGDIAIFLSLRKEFVDDLQDFAPLLNQPLDNRFRHRLRNWTPNDALSMLEVASAHDRVPFSQDLVESVIRDLERAGEVRPVEVQLVAMRLQELRVYEVREYELMGKATGVLSSYLKDLILPQQSLTPETYSLTGQYVLLSLCNESRTAKRTQGLSVEEIVERSRAELVANAQWPLFESQEKLIQSVSTFVEAGLKEYMFILEDEKKINLAHDYVAALVVDALGDIETVDTTAHRLLSQYLREYRKNARVRIPSQHLSMILLHASPDRRAETDAIDLLGKSTRRVRVIKGLSIGAAPLAAVVALIAFPPRVLPVSKIEEVAEGSWTVASNKRAAILISPDGKNMVWRAERPWENRQEFSGVYKKALISANGETVVALTMAREVVVDSLTKKDTVAATPILTLDAGDNRSENPRDFSENIFGSVSADGAWVASVSKNRVYLSRSTDKKINKDKPFFTIQDPRVNTHIEVLFAASGRYLILTERPSGRVFFSKLDNSPSTPVVLPAESISSPVLSRSGKIFAYFSTNDWLNVCNVSEESGVICATHRIPSKNVEAQNKMPPAPEWNFVISPDDKWIIGKRVGGAIRTLRVGTMPTELRLVVPRNETTMDSTKIAVCDTGQWIGALGSHGATFVWQINQSPSAEVIPVLPAGRGSPLVALSPDCNQVAAFDEAGALYAFAVGRAANLKLPLLPAGQVGGIVGFDTKIRWAADSKSVYAFNSNRVVWGRIDDHVSQAAYLTTSIEEIVFSADQKELIVLGEKSVARVQRVLHVFGIPVWGMTWPEVGRVDDSGGTWATGNFTDPD